MSKEIFEEEEGVRSEDDTRERVDRVRVLASSLQQMWNDGEGRWQPFWNRIFRSRAVLNGEALFQLPPEFLEIEGAQDLYIALPQKQTIPLKMLNVLSRKRPKLKRNPVGLSPRAATISTNIETWVNAAMESKVQGVSLVDWRSIVGHLFLDGACAVIVAPSLAHWADAPDYFDSLSAEEWRGLDSKTRARYTRVEDDGEPQAVKYMRLDSDGDALPREEYMVDGKGRGPDDDYYKESPKRKWKYDAKRTRKEFDDEEKVWLAQRLPFEVRVVEATACVPIFSTGEKLEGILIKKKFTPEELIERDYVWENASDLLMEEDSATDDDGTVTLYEYWGTDKDGTPFVSYSVDGKRTSFRQMITSGEDEGEELVDAIIDLKKEFGITRLPVKWLWGLRYETHDYAHKGIPFLWPIIGSIVGVEALTTSILVHAYATAFGTWAVEIDPMLMKQYPEVFLENGRPRQIKFSPMSMTLIPGRPIPLIHPGVGKDVGQLLQMLMASTASMAPSDAAFGGAGATSGHDRALTREYLETSMDQIMSSALDAYQFIGEQFLEQAVGISKKTGTYVPVYCNPEVIQVTGSGNRSQQQMQTVELRPTWIGHQPNLCAYYPQESEDNMAEVQQLAQLHMQGLITYRYFAEKAFGIESVEATLAEIWVDQYLRSPEGRAEIAQLAAEYMGADAEEERQRLIGEGRLTEGGTPTAALAPGDQPPPEMVQKYKNQKMAREQAAAELAKGGPMGTMEQGATGTGPAAGGPQGMQVIQGPNGQPGIAFPDGTVAPIVPGPDGSPVIMTPNGPMPIPEQVLAQMMTAANQGNPPNIIPQGTPGPAGPAPTGSGPQAPTLPGMALPNIPASAMGGRIAGETGIREKMRGE